MNSNDVKQLKLHYETQLQEKLSKTLNLRPEAINANWTLNSTVVSIVINQATVLTNFVFEYVDDNLIIHTSSYEIMSYNGVPKGIVANSATIGLNTIHDIFDIIKEVLDSAINEDTNDSTESKEG